MGTIGGNKRDEKHSAGAGISLKHNQKKRNKNAPSPDVGKDIKNQEGIRE